MKTTIGVALVTILLAGCASTKTFTPMERHANRAAGAEIAAMNCPNAGGYTSVAQMREDAAANAAQARAMGATEADLQAAKQRTQNEFNTGVFLVGAPSTCATLVNNLAWAGTTPAQ